MNEPDLGIYEAEWDDFPSCAPKAAVSHMAVLGDDGIDIHGYFKTAKTVQKVIGVGLLVVLEVIIVTLVIGGM